MLLLVLGGVVAAGVLVFVAYKKGWLSPKAEAAVSDAVDKVS